MSIFSQSLISSVDVGNDCQEQKEKADISNGDTQFPGDEQFTCQEMIPYGRQSINEDDIAAVVSALKSDFITQGPRVTQFEQIIADYCGIRYAISVNSATSALHIACLALGVRTGDSVWTSPITFVASANCALYCGAEIDFVDIDPKTYNLSVSALERKLLVAECHGKLPKVVIVVHLGGQACEMNELSVLAERFGFAIIEDASHAIGGYYQGKPIGNCIYSDITVFSFHPVKIITTAEGGMAVTNKSELAQRLKQLRSHGITRDEKKMSRESDGPWYYQQLELGFNYRMTDIQAALGHSQLKRLNKFVTRRQQIAQRYNTLLHKFPLLLPWQHPDTNSSWHLYIIRLRLDKITLTHKEIFKSLRARGIGVNLHYIPVHTQPYYQSLGFSNGSYPNAEKYYSEAISLPVFPDMTDAQQVQVCTVLSNVLGL